jgi:hypothetical protein
MGNINLELPEQLHKNLKLHAISTGVTLKELIISALTHGTNSQRDKKNPQKTDQKRGREEFS